MDFIMCIGIMFMFLSVIILYGVKQYSSGSHPAVLNTKKPNTPKPKPYPGDKK